MAGAIVDKLGNAQRWAAVCGILEAMGPSGGRPPAHAGRRRGPVARPSPSMGFLVSATFTPFPGSWIDREGPRVVIPVGALAMSAGLALAPFVSRPWHLYLTLGGLVSCGSVVVGYTGHSFFLPNWFVRRRGIPSACISSAGVSATVFRP